MWTPLGRSLDERRKQELHPPQSHLPSPGGTWQRGLGESGGWVRCSVDPRTHQGGKLGVAKGLGNLKLASLKTKPAAPTFIYLFQIQSAIFSIQGIIQNPNLPMFLPYLQPSISYFPHSHLTSLNWHSKPYFPEFPGSEVVRTQHFCYCGLSSIPGRGTKISQAVQSSQKQTNQNLSFPLHLYLHSLHYPSSSTQASWSHQRFPVNSALPPSLAY